MKSVGIKLLKDKLSAYLKLVVQGEPVLVTDRDEVIAEIRRPTFNTLFAQGDFESYLIDLESRNGLLRAKSTGATLQKKDLPPRIEGVDLQAILKDSRSYPVDAPHVRSHKQTT